MNFLAGALRFAQQEDSAGWVGGLPTCTKGLRGSLGVAEQPGIVQCLNELVAIFGRCRLAEPVPDVMLEGAVAYQQALFSAPIVALDPAVIAALMGACVTKTVKLLYCLIVMKNITISVDDELYRLARKD